MGHIQSRLIAWEVPCPVHASVPIQAPCACKGCIGIKAGVVPKLIIWYNVNTHRASNTWLATTSLAGS